MGSCRLSPGHAPPWPRHAVLLGLVALAAVAATSATAAGAPSLTVTSPPATLTYQSSSSATLAGSVDPANASLSVNGGPDLSDGSGSFSVVLPLSIGANNFSLRATDPAGASAWFNFTVVRDPTPPNITLTQPADAETLTNQPGLAVAGRVTDENGPVGLTLNGADISLNTDGSFSLTYTLTDGLNVLVFAADDLAGNEATLVRTATYDRYAPFLVVDHPPDGARTNRTSMEVLGRTERDANVTVNGLGATVNPIDGTFFCNVTLDALFDQTENFLIIRARDRAGNIAFANRTVVVDIRAPTIELDLDVGVVNHIEQGRPLNITSIVVRGSTDTADATMMVGGFTIPLSGLRFEVTVPLAEGHNNITIRATDDLNNTRTLVLHVVRDSTPPALDVAYPAATSIVVSVTSLTIVGTVDGGPGIQVRVVYTDDRGAQVTGEVTVTESRATGYSFTYNLPLTTDAAPHEVTVRAFDVALNVAEFTFQYVADLTFPALTVSPLPATVATTTVWVNGTTDDGVTTVLVNGHAFPVTGGAFAVEWVLEAREGPQDIEVTVASARGTERTVTFTVSVVLPPLPAAAAILVDGAAPDSHVEAGTPTRLSLDAALSPGVEVTWSVDGQLVGVGESVEVTLPPGEHTIAAIVSNGVHSEVFSYTVNAAVESSGTEPAARDETLPLAVAFAAAGAGAVVVLALRSRRARGRG